MTPGSRSVAGDLRDPLPDLGPFDVIVSGFAIHHLDHADKQRLFGEVADRLRPGGLFANLEVVASATPELHRTFLDAIGKATDDPEDQLADVESQLSVDARRRTRAGRLPLALAGFRAARRGRLIPTGSGPPNGPKAPSG